MENLDPSTVSIAIIGCGNPNRADDGAGPAVIDLLQQKNLPPSVGLFDAGTDGMAVLYRARGVRCLIIVDAKEPEGNAGAIYEVPGDVLEAPPPQSLNLHDFRWDHALFAGRKIYGDAYPAEVHVFLIESGSLELGLELSKAVRDATHMVADKIEKLVRSGAP